MKKVILLLVIIATCTLSAICTDSIECSIENSKWKLKGLVTSGSDEIKSIGGEDCERCFTLSFNENGDVYACGKENAMDGKYEISDGKVILAHCTVTEKELLCWDEIHYYSWLMNGPEYKFIDGELYLYVDENQHLIFRKI